MGAVDAKVNEEEDDVDVDDDVEEIIKSNVLFLWPKDQFKVHKGTLKSRNKNTFQLYSKKQ